MNNRVRQLIASQVMVLMIMNFRPKKRQTIYQPHKTVDKLAAYTYHGRTKRFVITASLNRKTLFLFY
jgi:hypothetical protein